MFSFLQRNFSGGEISPDFYAKHDLPKYGMSLKTVRNFFIDRFGNPNKRTGTTMCGTTPSNNPVKLITFYVTQSQGVLLEFTNGKLRLWYNGTLITDPDGTGNGYLTTPYLSDDLTNIKHRQPPGQTMYFVQGDHPPQQLVWTGTDINTGWAWSPINFVPSVLSDTAIVTAVAGASGTNNYQYKVTIEDLSTGEESFPMPVGVAQTPQNEVQGITGTNAPVDPANPINGSIRINFNGQYYTSSGSDSIAQIQAGLNALSSIGGVGGSVVVNGDMISGSAWLALFYFGSALPANPIKIEFAGSLANEPQPMITLSNNTFTCVNYPSGVPDPVASEITPGQSQYLGATQITYLNWNSGQKAIDIIVNGNHNLNSGDQVLLYNTNWPQLDNRIFNVFVVSENEVYIYVDGSEYTENAITTKSRMQAIQIYLANCAQPTLSNPNMLSWSYNPDNIGGSYPQNVTYNIYKGAGGVFGFIGTTQGVNFADTGIVPDVNFDPPNNAQRFVTSDDYPTVIELFQQRLILGAPQKNPLELLASRVGFYTNFTDHYNIQADDAIDVVLEAKHGGTLQNAISFGFLILLLDTGETVVAGDGTGTFTPLAANNRPQTFNGSSFLSPIVTNQNVIYVQAQSSLVRDISVTISPYGFTYLSGSDELTMFAEHLVQGHSIVEWDFQKLMDSTIWAVREDGKLLGLTYIKEQQICGWHQHDTNGNFENVCVVPEGLECVPYFCVNRNGTRFIERMSSDQWTNILNANYLDCMTSFDGRNTTPTTMTLSLTAGSTLWDGTQNLTLTASAPFFANSMVGDEIFLYGTDGYLLRFVIEGYTSTTVVTGTVRETVPDGANSYQTDGTINSNMRSVAITKWSQAVSSLTGLDYLNGYKVAVYADGTLVANPQNNDYLTLTVSGGALTLPENYAVIHVGLPYLADLETLDIDDPKGETFIDKKMKANRFLSYVKNTQDFYVGHKNPDTNPRSPQNQPVPGTTNLVYGLIESGKRKDENYDNPTALKTGRILTQVPSSFDYGASIFIRSIDPMPCNLEAIGVQADFQTGGK